MPPGSCQQRRLHARRMARSLRRMHWPRRTHARPPPPDTSRMLPSLQVHPEHMRHVRRGPVRGPGLAVSEHCFSQLSNQSTWGGWRMVALRRPRRSCPDLPMRPSPAQLAAVPQAPAATLAGQRAACRRPSGRGREGWRHVRRTQGCGRRAPARPAGCPARPASGNSFHMTRLAVCACVFRGRAWAALQQLTTAARARLGARLGTE